MKPGGAHSHGSHVHRAAAQSRACRHGLALLVCPLEFGHGICVFPRTMYCYGLLMLSSGAHLGGWCVRLPEGLVSHCTPSCFPLLGGMSAFLSPIVPLLVSLCWMVCPPSGGSCLRLSPIVPLLVSLCWMARPLPEGFVSLCLPLYPFLLPFVGWRVRFPRPLSPLLSHCTRPCLPACFPSRGHASPCFLWIISQCHPPCLPTCAVVDGASAFPKSPIVSFLAPFGWLPHLPEVFPPLLSHCLPLFSHVRLCWIMNNGVSFPKSCLPFFPFLFLCWKVCPPSRGLVSACLPLSPHMCASVGWCVCLLEVFSSLVSHCLPLSPHICACVGCCVPPLSLLAPACLPLSPHMCASVGRRTHAYTRLPKVLSPLVSLLVSLSRPWPRLSPSVSHLPSGFPLLLDGASAFPRSCLALFLFPTFSPHVCPWWLVCPPSGGLVRPCFPLSPDSVPVLDGAPAFLRPCLPLSPHMCACLGCCVRLPELLSHLVSHCHIFCPPVCLWWVMCPPCRGLVSPCLPLPPQMCACVGWCARIPEAFLPLVSHCLPCVLLLDGASASRKPCPPCLPLSPHVCTRVGWCVGLDPVSPIVSHCLSTCAPVVDGASAFPRSCLPLSPHTCACLGWCVRLPEVLPPRLPLSPTVSPHVCLRSMARPPSRGLVASCFPLSPISLLVFVGWFGRLPEAVASTVSHCLTLSPRMCAYVGWRARLPQDLSPIVTHGLPMVRPPPRGLASACLPLSCPSLSLFMFPFVAGGLISQFSPKGVLLAVLNAFSCV